MVGLGLSHQVSAIEVLLRNAQFYAPSNGPYVESNILIIGSSIDYEPTGNGKYAGAVEVTLLFKQGEAIVKADKYILNTVEIADTANVGVGIVDKKRYVLPNGAYVLEATFTDLNNYKTQTITEPLLVDFNYNAVQVSSLDLVDTYEKSDNEADLYVRSGLYMTPYVINFYPDFVDRLSFYTEIYNTATYADGGQILVTYSIKKHDKEGIPYGHFRQKKMKAEEVNAFLGEFDISNLPSGNYNLVLEVRNRENQMLAEKTMFFQRSKLSILQNPENLDAVNTSGTFAEQFNLEELRYQLRSMLPIATVAEAKTFNSHKKSEDVDLLRKLFYNFWVSRNDLNPYGAWEKYDAEVKKINYQFGTNLNYGFETDRGRIYLTYGAPSQIIDMPREPGAYPYQIWHYYGNIGMQSNVKFVFYAPDLVTNNYELIHSTARNELVNQQWERQVYKTFTGGNTPTDQNDPMNDHFGGRSSERFDE